MDILKIKRLAESHQTAIKDTIDALKAQGHDIGIRVLPHNTVFVAGVINGTAINEAFYLDNQESIRRLDKFNRSIRTNIRVPKEHGRSLSMRIA